MNNAKSQKKKNIVYDSVMEKSNNTYKYINS